MPLLGADCKGLCGASAQARVRAHGAAIDPPGFADPARAGQFAQHRSTTACHGATPGRVATHSKQLLGSWRETLARDVLAERPGSLRESLLEGIALLRENVTDMNPAS